MLLLRTFFLVLSTMFTASSWLFFHTTESLLVWKLTIIVTEYGHYFAVFTLLLFFLSLFLYWRGRRLPWAISSLLMLYCTFIFMSPTILLRKNLSSWQDQLAKSFGQSSLSKEALPSLGKLYLGPFQFHPMIPQSFVFENLDNKKLELDFYPAKSIRAAPWVLVIHGGGWDSGERTQLPELNSVLAKEGYAVASVDYRLAPQFQWPSQKADILAAVNFLKSHAAELHLDPNRWVILGRSAGGQIAESLAYENPDPGLKGCIAFYAPSDLLFAYIHAREDDILKSRSLIRNYLGGAPEQAPVNYSNSSPLNFVRKDSLPTLLFHGPNDSLVWVRQSERLIAKLTEEKVPAAFIKIPWATHGFDFNLHGPGGQISTFAIRYFLRQVFDK